MGTPQFTSGKAEADGLELALCHSQPLCLQKSMVLFCLCLMLNDFVSLFNFYFSHLRDDAFLDKPLNVLVFFFLLKEVECTFNQDLGGKYIFLCNTCSASRFPWNRKSLAVGLFLAVDWII